MRAAIKGGDFKEFRDLFSSTAFEPDRLLAMAAQNNNTAPKQPGHTEIVDFLIAHGARPSCGMLFEAARDGSQAIVDRLVAGGAELDIFTCSAIGDLALVRVTSNATADLLRRKSRRGSRIIRTSLHCIAVVCRRWADNPLRKRSNCWR